MRVLSEPSLERSQKEASARSEYLKERFRKRSVALPELWKRAEEPSGEQSLVLSPSHAVQADCHP